MRIIHTTQITTLPPLRAEEGEGEGRVMKESKKERKEVKEKMKEGRK